MNKCKDINGLSVWYRSETEDELVLNDSFENDLFYRELPYLRFAKKPIIVDVGAHIGTFAMLSAIKFPDASIFAFEASLDTFSLLKKNVESNSLQTRIKYFHQALCGTDGPVTLFHNEEHGNWGHTISREISSSAETVNGVSLSTFIREYNIAEIDLIKFNCEGAEFDILLSMSSADLRKISCAIILYHLDLTMIDKPLEKLVARLEEASLKFFFLHQTPQRGWLIVFNEQSYSPLWFPLIGKIKRKLRSLK